MFGHERMGLEGGGGTLLPSALGDCVNGTEWVNDNGVNKE